MSDYSGLPRTGEDNERRWSGTATVAAGVALVVGALVVLVVVWLLEIGPVF